MSFIRANGIPIWVTILAILIGVMGTQLGVTAMLDPTSAQGYIDGADAIGLTWGGRNTGLGVALIVAVLLRNPSGYAVAFAASIFRELSDIINLGITSGTGIGLTVFLLIEVVCLIISVRASLAERANTSPA